MALTIYQYPSCSTCRRAVAFLDKLGITYDKVDITKAPPTAKQLAAIKATAGAPLRALFNTSGESYRAGDFKTKLPTMTEAQALAALAADGKLIKRPLLVGGDVALIGFDEAAWRTALVSR
jgi:arsenate reductase